MAWMPRLIDKAGALGTVVSAASCPVCFPAIASLGAAAGLGFLSEFEGLFIRILLPTFAAVALLANAAGWFNHRQWHRALLGVMGPAIVLAAMLLFFGHWWTARLLYTGLAFMVGVSLWDLISPAARRCRDGECATPGRTATDGACDAIQPPLTQATMAAVSRQSVLTCPHCGHAKAEIMPTDACQFFYECENCRTLLRPKPGDCCVFCSFGSTKCPPVQLDQRPFCEYGSTSTASMR